MGLSALKNAATVEQVTAAASALSALLGQRANALAVCGVV